MTLHGWVYAQDAQGNPVEIINHARTLAYLRRVGIPGLVTTIFDDDAGCAGLAYNPYWEEGDPSVPWQPYTFLTPSTGDTAPWYDGTAASGEALGCWVEEWTGLDGSHHTRPVTQRGLRPGGAWIGSQYHKERVMKVNMLLFASTERGMRHLFRWFESTLLNARDYSGLMNWWLREHCPTATTSPSALEEGLMLVRGVALLEGPTFEADPMSDARCVVRRVSFTVAVSDPCLYGVPRGEDTEVVSWTPSLRYYLSADSTVTEIDHPLRPRTNPTGLTGGSVVSAAVAQTWATPSPRVLITSDAVYDTPPTGFTPGTTTPTYTDGVYQRLLVPQLSVYVTTNLFVDLAFPGDPALDLVVNSDLVACVDLKAIPSGTDVLIDFAAREIYARDTTTGEPLAQWESGWKYVADRGRGFPRWPQLAAGIDGQVNVAVRPTFDVSVMQVASDMYVVPDADGNDVGTLYQYSWTTTIDFVDRWGCA